LKLLFGKALTFDLADAKLAAPPNVAAITQKMEGDTAVVELLMVGDVDVHSFREDKNYVIDVAFQQPDKGPLQQLSDAAHAPPARAAEKTPANPAPAAAMPAAEKPVVAEKPPANSEKSVAPAAAMAPAPPMAET